jgi:hypothetical protein
MLRWLLFGVLVVATLFSVGLDAASMPHAAQVVDLVAERAITPALEAQWERTEGARASAARARAIDPQ